MKLIGVLLLIGLAASAPISYEDEKIEITEEFFPEEIIKYTSEYDIVKIFVPLNALNIEEDTDSTENENDGDILFFVQGNHKDDGTFDNKGLFVLNTETGEATKLLDNGVDSTAAIDDTKNVYFAATDGIYVYNAEKNAAEKYGSVAENIISIAKTQKGDVIYALTADKDLYKVTENGEKKVKVDDVKDAQQIVLDKEDNLYYYDDKMDVYVVSKDGVKKIEGLPEYPGKITLLRPAFVMKESIPVVMDDKWYLVYANGTSKESPFELKVQPTAYSMEGTLVQYYAYNKSIYEYTVQIILELILGSALEELNKFLDDNSEIIQELGKQSRKGIRTYGKH